ncbi:MAG: DUF5671 domain-containing protein [Minisyncoccia bacterium]
MENTPVAKAEPKDFFLWAGALIALYAAITSFITLLFEYINYSFPDSLAGWSDPYSGSIRFSMAALIVLAPTVLILMRLIRNSIAAHPEKATVWVRRWALMLTLFAAGATIVIDLITLLYTFLGGEISTRFSLKVAVILLVAVLVFLHFLADIKGYWIRERAKANLVGIAVFVLALLSVVAGFFIVGSPNDIRMVRYDERKVSDLQAIQWELVNFWQQKQTLPKTLDELKDPLSSFMVPMDIQTDAPYVYEVVDARSFKLCATFNRETQDTKGRGEYPAYYDTSLGSGGTFENWKHGEGVTCFTRTIDPQRYPPLTKGI